MMYVHNIDTPHKNTQNVYFSSKQTLGEIRFDNYYYHNKVICKVTLSFTPLYLLFQWFPQNKEILLNISVWNAETQYYLMYKVQE
jgi:hypothetical protein